MDRRPWKLIGGVVTSKIGIDGITYDSQNDIVYYTPNNGGAVYSLKEADLRSFIHGDLCSGCLAQKVNFVAHTTMTDGMTTDSLGNIYLTDTEHSS